MGRALGVSPPIGWLILVGFGVIVSATLTPQREALEFAAAGPSSCNFGRLGPAELSAYLVRGETAGNVLMFIPLGVAIALLPRSRGQAGLIVAATALPSAIEMAQLLVPALDRACESGDVVDNLMGLAVGLAVGLALVAAIGLGRSPDRT